MSVNRYQPCVFVLPEDDANRQIANGFILNLNLNGRAIQVLPPARGWVKVVEKFTEDHIPEMRLYTKRMMVLLIDFDDQQGQRLSYVQSKIPTDLIDRVFVIGVLSEPERLKGDINKSFENIGESLAKDCADNTNELWGHNLLKHNKTELERMVVCVKPFLFNL
ncbi:hypothetical protein [Nostoc sp. TCL26-01]|uniref:hypothetical protein n=1 Tax=Nostoc sp. TCL26-01 TaxID=2576904 RepID=UPI0015BB815D|nr:hypothetical protein [Nostoc sp. TCL26-01]QLE56691.1 hypothetical protein FD725_14965 [Nostoc sp. TCL26-01]